MRYRFPAAALAALTAMSLLSSCSSKPVLYSGSLASAGMSAPETSEEISLARGYSSWYTSTSTGNCTLTHDEREKLQNILSRMSEQPLFLPKSEDTANVEYTISSFQGFSAVKYNDGWDSWVKFMESGLCCSDTKELDEFTAELFKRLPANDNSTTSTPADPAIASLLECSLECPMPANNEEYIATAQAVLKPWLNSLSNVSGRYRLGAFQYDKGRHKSEVDAAGYYNGALEFAVFTAFSADDIADEETENSAFSESGSYDTFYQYYFGPSVYARFRWEDGVCRVVDYADVFGFQSGRLSNGLYGVNTYSPEYPTFFEFLADTDRVKEYEERFPDVPAFAIFYKSISQNVYMISDGRVFAITIGYEEEPTKQPDGTLRGEWFENVYGDIEGNLINSPVYYPGPDDTQLINFHDGFKLVFDDYNMDGNPDYAIKIDSDENGSTYYVECIDNSGKPYLERGEVYVPGRFDDSLRMQVLGDTLLAVPRKDSSGNISMAAFNFNLNRDTNFVDDVQIDDVRMYSQRSYLPEELRSYEDGTQSIVMHIWNNTAQDIAAGGSYTIEKRVGAGWEEVYSGSCSDVTVPAFNNVDVNIDVSGITDSRKMEYRVAMNAGGNTVYGGFWMGSTGAPQLVISGEEECPRGGNKLSFTVENSGSGDFSGASGKLLLSGKELCDVEIPRISSGESAEVSITSVMAGMPEGFSAGEYTLKIMCDEAFSDGTAKLLDIAPERRYFFDGCKTSKSGDTLKITLKNRIYSDKTAEASYYSVYHLRDGMWQSSSYNNAFDASSEFTLEPGDVITLELADFTRSEDIMNQLKAMASQFQDYEGTNEELSILKNGIPEEIMEKMYGDMRTASGELCRLTVNFKDGSSEYVYFIMP